MSENTRLRIINYLKVNRLCSAEEISSALSMTKANIQYHLQSLLKDDMIEAIKSTQHKVRGRPTYRYCLNFNKQENNYQNLCAAFLKFIFINLGDTGTEKDLKPLQSLTCKLFKDIPEPSADLLTRLNQTVQTLNQNAYQARWEAHKDGPRIYFDHCPYLSLVQDFPILCQMDTFFLNQLLNNPVNISRVIIDAPTVPSYCLFILN